MIEYATYSDIDDINKLGYNYNIKFNKLYSLKDYINNNNYIVLVSRNENNISGFIIAEKLIDSIDIELVFVDENFRKQGIGKLLVDSLLKYKKIINLEVNNNNIAARNLYKKCGFKENGIRKAYYNGEDCIMMRKEI